MKPQAEALLQAALRVRENAYAPYSHFCVGAALLGADGVVYTGCNVENVSVGATNCAERTALFYAGQPGRSKLCAHHAASAGRCWQSFAVRISQFTSGTGAPRRNVCHFRGCCPPRFLQPRWGKSQKVNE